MSRSVICIVRRASDARRSVIRVRSSRCRRPRYITITASRSLKSTRRERRRSNICPSPRSVPHLRLPAQGALAVSEIESAIMALGLDQEPPDVARPFVHLTVKVDGPAAGLKAEVDAICDRFPIRLVSLAIERPQAAAPAAPAAPVRLAERQPSIFFREAFEATHGVPVASASAMLRPDCGDRIIAHSCDQGRKSR